MGTGGIVVTVAALLALASAGGAVAVSKSGGRAPRREDVAPGAPASKDGASGAPKVKAPGPAAKVARPLKGGLPAAARPVAPVAKPTAKGTPVKGSSAGFVPPRPPVLAARWR